MKECIRCTYRTSQKSSMRKHLYKETPCPASRNEIELSVEIKEKILANRSYQISQSKQHSTVLNQMYVTNNIGSIMNVITPSMSDTDRVMSYLEYVERDPICLCDDITNLYGKEVEMLRNDSYKYAFEMTIDDLLEIMDNITKCRDKDNYTDLNIIFNTKDKKINILDDTNEWSESLVDKGLRVMVEKVQDGYLHDYERYLLIQIQKTSGQINQEQKERLINYYTFLAWFDTPPLCSEKNKLVDECFITYNVIDKFFPVYKSVYDKIKKAERNKMKSQLLDILKRNSDKNMKNLYNNFYDLFSNNNDFKEFINCKLSLNS